MTKQPDESKAEDESKGAAFNPHGRRNVANKNRLLVKLYSLLAVLVLTLALIGILEYAQRSLPTSQKSHFKPLATGTSSIESTALKTQASSATRILTGREAPSAPSSPEAIVTGSLDAGILLESTQTDLDNYKRQAGSPVAGDTPGASVASTVAASSSSPAASTINPSAGDVVAISATPENDAVSTPPPTSTNGNSSPAVAAAGDTLSNSSTDVFVPPAVTTTLGAAICTATATTIGCTCPQSGGSNALPCTCAVDTAATSCTCVVSGTGDAATQSCTCPPDTCTTCRCPFDSAGGSSFLTECGCPSSPEAEGCQCTFREPDPDTPSEALCPQVKDCSCGTNVRADQCAAAVVATAGAVSGVPASTALIISSTSTSATTEAAAAIPTKETTSSPAEPVLPTSTSTPTSTLTSTSSSTSTSTSTSAQATVTAAAGFEPQTQTQPQAQSQPQPQPNTPVAVVVPAPSISVSTGTNSQGQPFTTSILILPAPTASGDPAPLVFIVSNSLSTASNGQVSAVPVTLLQAQANELSSVAPGTAGQEFAIPTVLFQSQSSKSESPVPSAPPTASAGPGGTGSSGAGGGSTGASTSNSTDKAILTWPKSKTFLGGYLPVMIAKFHQMGWTAMCQQSLDHAGFNSLLGQSSYTPLVTCAGGVVSWMLIPFASDVIYFDTNYGCENPNPLTPANPCWPPRMTTNGWVLRLVQGFLSVTAAVSVALIAMWFVHPHGAQNDPTSIAAVAAIAGHPTVVKDFSCPADMTSLELKKSLKGKKYKLDEFVNEAGVPRFGLVPAYDPAALDAQRDEGENSQAESKTGFITRLRTPWKENLFYADGFFFCYLIVLLAITTAYLRDVEKSVFAKLFPGSTVGRRIVFAVIAAIAGLNFNRIEKDTQTLTPYMSLKYLDAAPTPTICLRRHTLPLTSFLPLLRNKHFIPATIAFIGIVGEFLVVTLSGLPYRPGQLRSEFLFCASASLAILLLMLAGVVVVNIWRFLLPTLPRKPDKVSNVLTYVAGAKMCDDFEGLERLKVEERDKRIAMMSKRYGYGQRKTDDEPRWMVDTVENDAEAPEFDHEAMAQKIPVENQMSVAPNV